MAEVNKTAVPPSLALAWAAVISAEKKAATARGTCELNRQVMYPVRSDSRSKRLQSAETAARWLLSRHAPKLPGRQALDWITARKMEIMRGIFPPKYWRSVEQVAQHIVPNRAAAGWRDQKYYGLMQAQWFSILALDFDVSDADTALSSQPIFADCNYSLELSAEKRGNPVWLQPSCTALLSSDPLEETIWKDDLNAGFALSRFTAKDLNPPSLPWSQTWNVREWYDCRAQNSIPKNEAVKSVRLNLKSQSTRLRYGIENEWAQCILTAQAVVYVARSTQA